MAGWIDYRAGLVSEDEWRAGEGGTVGRAQRVVARVKAGRRARVAAGAVVATLLTVLLFAVGCGQVLTSGEGVAPVTEGPTSTTVAEAVPTSTSAASPSTSNDSQAVTSTTVSSSPVAPADVEEVFRALAASVEPMKVFAPAALPEGAALAPRWLPVVESSDPEAYEGPEQANPQVVGTGPDSEIQVVFRAGSGWLVVIENFHGDLGDVAGIPVGLVGGNAAALFEVNGGELVQWSQDGRWYGVFGRGVSRDAILAAALGMETVSTEVRGHEARVSIDRAGGKG
jgi:hypothetical protein